MLQLKMVIQFSVNKIASVQIRATNDLILQVELEVKSDFLEVETTKTRTTEYI